MRILLLPLFFISIGVIYFVFFGDIFPIPESSEDLLIILASYKDEAWIVAICIIIGDVILPLPSDITIFTLGILYGPIIGGALGSLGTFIAGIMGFYIARIMGEKGALFLLGENDLARANQFYEKWGFLAVALGRAIGGPAEYLVITAGLTKMSPLKVTAAVLIGGVSSSFCMAYLGSQASDSPYLAVISAVTMVVLLLAIFQFLSRKA